VAGSELLVASTDEGIEELKVKVQDSFTSILSTFEKQPEGVYVKASTLGSLEALLSFLNEQKIPVFDVGIGDVHTHDVRRALLVKEKRHKEYALVLAFDVKVSAEARVHADNEGLPIFTAEIIYHLFDQFAEHMANIVAEKKKRAKHKAVFPAIVQVDKRHIYHTSNPLIFGAEIIDGQLRVGTPLCVPDKDFLEIGHVASIEKDRRPMQSAHKGEKVCVKLDQNSQQTHLVFGRHFDWHNMLYSKITRESINAVKEDFKDELNKDNVALLRQMKKLFKIQ